MSIGASMLVKRTDRGDDMFVTSVGPLCPAGPRPRGRGHAAGSGSTMRAAAGDPARPAHAVDPVDEQRHDPGTEAALERVLLPRLRHRRGRDRRLRPDRALSQPRGHLVDHHAGGRRAARWWPSVAYDLPVAGGTGLVLDAGGVEMRGVVDDPLATMTSGDRPPRRRLRARPEDVYPGHRVGRPPSPSTCPGPPTGCPTTTTSPPATRCPAWSGARCPSATNGWSVSGQGQRDHSWGVRDWWAFGWCWAAARLDDGTRVHMVDDPPARPAGPLRLRAAAGWTGPAGRVVGGHRAAGLRRSPRRRPRRRSSPAAWTSGSTLWPSAPSCWSPPTDGSAAFPGPRPGSRPLTDGPGSGGSSGTSRPVPAVPPVLPARGGPMARGVP